MFNILHGIKDTIHLNKKYVCSQYPTTIPFSLKHNSLALKINKQKTEKNHYKIFIIRTILWVYETVNDSNTPQLFSRKVLPHKYLHYTNN